jgi:hypothetical protein
MFKQDLENQLNSLRLKWKGDYPKNDLDKRWWRFNTDKLKAEQLKTQIKKIDAGELSSEEMEKIFK